jgi:hypothetical protein
MNTGDWITLGAVIVALILGVVSIIHTQWLWKKGRRLQFISGIIRWAEDIIAWDIDTSYEAKKELEESNEPLWVILLQLQRLRKGYYDFERKGKSYILEYLNVFKNETLTSNIDSLINILKEQEKLIGNQEIILMKLITNKATKLSDEFNDAQDSTIGHIKTLKKKSEEIIEESVRIRVKI